MSDHDADLRRYAALSDRLALGEALAPDEHAFLERMRQKDDTCRLEAELFASLADLDGQASDQTRSLVDAALAQVASDAARTSAVGTLPRRRARGRSRRWIGWGSAAALAASALLFVALRGSGPKQGSAVAARIELVYLSGEVEVGGAPALSSSRLLREGDVLSVKNGGACIAMDPEIDVCATAGTRLRLTSTSAAARRLDLLEGKVAVQLATQPEGSRLSIVSDGVWSTAVGTAFAVQRDAKLGVETTVLHGKVRVGESDARSKIVSAHQRARMGRKVGAARDPEVTAISRSDESPDWALLGPSKLWNDSVTATLEVSEAPRGAQVTLDGHAIGIAPLSTLVPAGTRQVEVRVGGEAVWSRQIALVGGQREKVSLAGIAIGAAMPPPIAVTEVPQAVPVTKAPAVPVTKTPAVKARSVTSSGGLLREAQRLLREGDMDAAADKYSELVRVYPASAEARSSLLSLAELELEHLGNARAALNYAERYLASGAGTLAPEAREARVRALRSLGRRAEERAAIEDYLRAHPESLRASSLSQRLAELGGSLKLERDSADLGLR